MATDLHWSATNLVANMPLPEGCGGMLFQSFRVFLIVVLTVVLTGGLVAMLWNITRGRWRPPGHRSFPEPVLLQGRTEMLPSSIDGPVRFGRPFCLRFASG
jgi:hypothetical protein